jgi:hypothetical protein
MEIDKEEIRRTIENIEFIANGMRWINGASVEVVNIRILKREGTVIADVLYLSVLPSPSKCKINCEYPFEVLGIVS